MSDAGTHADSERYARCRNLLREASPKNGTPIPGRYCVNSLGVVSVLDCPVYQGASCCLFEEIAGGEEPPVADEDRLVEVREMLAADYLRWPYWRRVARLKAESLPGEHRVLLADLAEPEPEEEEDLAELVRVETEPRVEEPPPEKYPGQRRSEDRRKARKPAEEAEKQPPGVESRAEPRPQARRKRRRRRRRRKPPGGSPSTG